MLCGSMHHILIFLFCLVDSRSVDYLQGFCSRFQYFGVFEHCYKIQGVLHIAQNSSCLLLLKQANLESKTGPRT